MKILKILQKEPPVSKVKISKYISGPLNEELNTAKGVMENYMRDKAFNVNITRDIFDDSDKNVCVTCSSPRCISTTAINSEGEPPFLRKVYMVIEKFAKDQAK